MNNTTSSQKNFSASALSSLNSCSFAVCATSEHLGQMHVVLKSQTTMNAWNGLAKEILNSENNLQIIMGTTD